MYGMNFLIGANFGFGGFGGFGCCCRPNPFMLGYMRGYLSAKIGYAMMGCNSGMPSIFGANNQSQMPQNYFYPQQTAINGYDSESLSYQQPSYSAFVPDPELKSRYAEASQKWQNALSGLADSRSLATNSASTSVSDEAALLSAASSLSSTKTSAAASSTAPESATAATSAQKVKSSSDFVTKVKSDKDFKTRVEEVARSIVCKPEDLLALMNSESGLKANAQNKSGRGAVGLIQFTKPAIDELNRHGIKITKEELLKMDAVEQLDYVEKYLKIAKSYKFAADYPLSAGDLYAINFLPGRAGRESLASSGDKYYEANRGLDVDGDGVISKSDLAKRLDKFSVSLVA